MVLSPRRRRGDLPPSETENIAPIQFRLEAGQDQLVTEDGQQLEGRGYVICDAQTGAPLGEDDFFFRIGGGMVTDLVGAEAHLAELQNNAFRPGRALALPRHPAVSGEVAPVVEVFDLSRTVKAGELPADVADAVALYGAESYEAALCLWEWRSAAGQRVGLRLLLAPDWTVEELTGS